MLSGSHEQLPQESLEIKQDDKFFTRIMSKETSMANSSCRVYYGGVSGAVPFLWESRPGTPKHIFSDTSIPPLTPPPSYYSTSSSSISKSMHKAMKPNLFSTIFTSFVCSTNKRTHVSPSSFMTSTTTSSSSSWSSSSQSSASTFKILKLRKRLCFSCPRSSIHDNDDDDDKDQSSYTSRLRYNGNNKIEGSYLMKI